ncbi:hypothetical protein BK745P3_00034 [Bacteroides phage BK745P3]|nr:hypothetical protein BK745P3_00034 [Bacteroides phage BK745P3]
MYLIIILAAVLIMIAAYYPIKLIKFYSMESKEQGLKAKITQDLREGRVSRNLILLVLGEGGLRLTRNQLDVIFEWMIQNTNAWKVHTYKDGRIVVVFAHSPFHPEEWDNYEDYKHVMRQMFGDYGTRDFLTSRSTVEESYRIRKNLDAIDNPIKLYDYVTFDFNGVPTLGMVTTNSLNGKCHTVKILSGELRGIHSTVKNASKIEPDEAIKELARQKEEWKNKKREEAIAKRHEEFRSRYGNILHGSYLKKGDALYLVESVDVEEEKATAIRLLDLGPNFPAGEKCVLYLVNNFTLVTAEEAAEILLKEYSHE